MRKAFTLIETIVVVAVIGMTLPVLFAIIFTLMRQQIKIYRLSQIKREGDYLINLVENTIKNRAVVIYKSTDFANDTDIVCKAAGSSWSNPYFFDEEKQWFDYILNSSSIASNSAYLSAHSLPAINLTSSKIKVSGFSISCSRNSAYSPASILLSFDICYDTGVPNCVTTRPEEIASMHYQTRIKLRNY